MNVRGNKRRYMRTRAQNLVAHVRVGDKSIQAPVEDISMGGILARTVESIPIGTAVMFDLARPGLKKPLRLLGVVVDTRVGRGLGIRFDGLDKDTSDRLEELIGSLGGMTSGLLVDKTDTEIAIAAPPPRTATAPPMPAPFAPSLSNVHVSVKPTPAPPAPLPPLPLPAPPLPAPAPAPAPSDNEAKLQAQLRSLVMELGRLQEVVAQREKELHDARAEIVRLKSEAGHGDAAQRVVGKLEIEKSRLEQQLAEQRGRSKAELDQLTREAELVASALARMIDGMKRLR